MGGLVAGAIFLLSVLTPINSPAQEQTPPVNQISSKIPTPTPTRIPPTPTPIMHVVESGETLYTIAEEQYGDQKYWINLWNDNDFIKDPRLIRSGWELNISRIKPEKVEEPSEKLAAIYKEITDPSPTPTPTNTPTQEVNGAQTPSITQGPPSSFDNVYKEAGAKYGVPWEILYGLHHMETGGRDGAISSGYGTGAQGPLQFMPGTWASYGADGNGDGNPDINNALDAIHGAANYISKHGGVEQGLKSYGGDSEKALNLARSRGYSP